jgi:pyruvate kinase
VATVGPASRDERTLRELIEAGVDVFRLNFSHGDAEQHGETCRLIRRLSSALDAPVAVLQDLQGPKIRVGDLHNGEPVLLASGDRVTLTSRDVPGSSQEIPTTYEGLAQDTQPGDRLLLDDGALELRALDSRPPDVVAEVVRGGLLRQRKGINLPGVRVSAPALTTKDFADLRTGAALGVDFVALSFVRRPEDIELARRELERLGVSIPIITKLEKPEAIARLDEILDASDGVMVARGDLGVEMSPERVPIIQKDVLRRTLKRGMPSITATQMLESMVSSPRPTRAEASDVANAILDGSGAVMLSAETASGQYPVESVRMMRRIALETESSTPAKREEHGEHPTPVHALSDAVYYLAKDLTDVCAVVPMTNSGYSAQLMSAARPPAIIWAYTYSERVRSLLSLWWGVRPLLMPKQQTTEEAIAWVESDLLARGYVQPGAMLVITGGMPLLAPTRTNFIKLHRVGAPKHDQRASPSR